MEEFEGFYVGYFTGGAGNSVALFVFRDGHIAGADMGGGTYDGQFEPSSDHQFIEGSITFHAAPGTPLITGGSSSAPVEMEVPIKFSKTFANGETQKIETPFGPLNARFQQIRSFE